MRAFFTDFSTPVCLHPRRRTPSPAPPSPLTPPSPPTESSGGGDGGGSVFLITTAIFFSSRDDAVAKRYRNIPPTINPVAPSRGRLLLLSTVDRSIGDLDRPVAIVAAEARPGRCRSGVP